MTLTLRAFFQLLLLGALTLGVFTATTALAQELETGEHTFENEGMPPPPTQEELDLVSRLSEKYIIGTITEAELAKLREYKSTFADLDSYKAQYEAEVTFDDIPEENGAPIETLDPTLPDEGLEELYPANTSAPATAPADTTPNWMVLLTIFNSVLLLVMAAIVVLRK